jgi:hypothetical protein
MKAMRTGSWAELVLLMMNAQPILMASSGLRNEPKILVSSRDFFISNAVFFVVIVWLPARVTATNNDSNLVASVNQDISIPMRQEGKILR